MSVKITYKKHKQNGFINIKGRTVTDILIHHEKLNIQKTVIIIKHF